MYCSRYVVKDQKTNRLKKGAEDIPFIKCIRNLPLRGTPASLRIQE